MAVLAGIARPAAASCMGYPYPWPEIGGHLPRNGVIVVASNWRADGLRQVERYRPRLVGEHDTVPLEAGFVPGAPGDRWGYLTLTQREPCDRPHAISLLGRWSEMTTLDRCLASLAAALGCAGYGG
jgi:hypothetical protein